MKISKILLAIVVVALCIGFVAVSSTATSSTNSAWQYMGPPSSFGIQSLTMRVAAATTAALPSKKVDGTSLWVAATVNSGVWFTTATPITDAVPVWTQSTGDTPQSVSALHVSAYQKSRVYVGAGAASSSQMGFGWNVLNDGPWTGVFLSEDGGMTFSRLPGFPVAYSVHAILEAKDGSVLVATRGTFSDANSGGGIWRCASLACAKTGNFSMVFSANPVMSLFEDASTGDIYGAGAACTAAQVIVYSGDSGKTWLTTRATGIDFGYLGPSMKPYWSQLSGVSGKALYLLVYLAPDSAQQPWFSSGIASGSGNVYYFDLSTKLTWKKLGGQPMLSKGKGHLCAQTCTDPATDCCVFADGDLAQKDRGACTPEPSNPSGVLYCAFNGGFQTFRVDVQKAIATAAPCTLNLTSATCINDPTMSALIWHPMSNLGSPWPMETKDEQTPHVDFRSAFVDPATNNLVVTSDGGIFVRTLPSETGGKNAVWRDFVGIAWGFEHTAGSMLVDWDDKTGLGGRAAGAAQDNGVQITSTLGPSATGFGYTYGDGLNTWVDQNTRQIFGNNQFLSGIASVDLSGVNSNINDAAYVLNATYRGVSSHGVTLRTTASVATISQMAIPFFQAAAGINLVNSSSNCAWINRTTDGTKAEEAGIYCWNPYVAESRVTRVMQTDENIIALVTGVDRIREYAIVAASPTSLFIRSSPTSTVPTKIRLSDAFSEPCNPTIVTGYCNSWYSTANNVPPCTSPDSTTYWCMSWPNHFSSVYLAAYDTNRIAISGWSTLSSNSGIEKVLFTTDADSSASPKFYNIIGNLCSIALTALESQATNGICRPGALAFLTKDILTAGTSTGMFWTDLSQAAASGYTNVKWKPLSNSFPRVKVSSAIFYPAPAGSIATPSADDLTPTFAGKLVVATLGRSIWVADGKFTTPSLTKSQVGMIVGVVFGVLAAVTIVFVVVYFKKKQGGRDTEAYNAVQGGGDSGHQQYSASSV